MEEFESALFLTSRDDPSSLVADPLLDAVDDPSDALRRFGPLVAGVGFRILGSRKEAEDLVAEILRRVRQGLDCLRDPEPSSGFLVSISVRESESGSRLRRWHLESANHPDNRTQPSYPAPFPLRAEVVQILDTLPSEVRVPWQLRYVEGFSFPEVAVACGCSLATVKRRIASAQLAMQSVLGGRYSTPRVVPRRVRKNGVSPKLGGSRMI